MVESKPFLFICNVSKLVQFQFEGGTETWSVPLAASTGSGLLTAVVLALVLWFVLSGGVENYRAKYEGYDLSQQIGDIGRSSTYSLYLRAHEGARTHLRTFPFRW